MDKIDGNSPSFGVVITVTCVLAPHYFLYFPSFLCAIWPPVCVGTMAMLPLAGFTHSHHSLAWSLAVYGPPGSYEKFSGSLIQTLHPVYPKIPKSHPFSLQTSDHVHQQCVRHQFHCQMP